MSRYYDRGEWDDDDLRGRPSRRGWSSPDNNDPYFHDGPPAPRHPPPTRYSREPYDDGPLPPRLDEGRLGPPPPHDRPRSMPPQHALIPRPPSPHRHYSRSPSPRHRPQDRPRGRDSKDVHPNRTGSRSRSRSRSRNPAQSVRHAVDRTFTNSSSGLGVGLLGAVVGGLAAREASNAAIRTRSKKELKDAVGGTGRGPYTEDEYGDHGQGGGGGGPIYHPPHPLANKQRRRSSASRREADNSRLVSTVVGALVGGLGANAIEKRFQNSRQRLRKEQSAWEDKWGSDGAGDDLSPSPPRRRHDPYDDHRGDVYPQPPPNYSGRGGPGPRPEPGWDRDRRRERDADRGYDWDQNGDSRGGPPPPSSRRGEDDWPDDDYPYSPPRDDRPRPGRPGSEDGQYRW